MSTATADPLVGRLLEGRYRLRTHLARGGMSTVYSANDERLDRLVAVKIMSPSLSADPAFTDRFTREARSAAKLTHLNAVSVYDQGSDTAGDGPLVFLVMELVNGRTLRDLLRERGRLSPAQAVSVMEPILAALAAAHRAGLVHRDVKPENILLSDDGVVKVADFGLARAVESDGSSTHTGLMMGTVAYCSPEQISRGRADQRSDVYSAGVLLFELLTGTAPYVGDSAVNVAYQHVHGRVPPPSTRTRGIAPALDDLVVRATDSDPAGRPLDAGAMLAELSDVRHDLGLPVVAIPPRPAVPGAPRAGDAADARTESVGLGSGSTRGGSAAATGRMYSRAGTHDTIVEGAGEEGGPPPPVVIPPPRRRRQRSARSARRRRTLIVVLIVLLLGLAAGAGGWWLVAGRFARVPAVAGQPSSSAAAALRHAGFHVAGDSDSQFSETIQSGNVISTDPGPGSRLVRGKNIIMIISKGQDRVTVPSTSSLSADAAQQLLQTLFTQVVQTQASDKTIATGKVIGTDPAAGARIRPDALVKLIISSGPPVVTVPSVLGKPQADAESLLTGAGFTVTQTQDYSDTVPAGTVISQNPSGDGQALDGSAVTIDVSKGKQTVQIPSIAELTPVKQATQELEALGLHVKVNKEFGGHAGAVVGVDPATGTTVNIGSTVTLTIV